MDELEKIDLIRSRARVGYKEAREVLEEAGGDVVQALIRLENKEKMFQGKINNCGREFMGQVRGMWHKGGKTRVKVKKGDKTVFEFPASVGAVGLLGALVSTPIAVLGAFGTVAAMANNYTLEIKRSDPGINDDNK